jgi:hypothetical protein
VTFAIIPATPTVVANEGRRHLQRQPVPGHGNRCWRRHLDWPFRVYLLYVGSGVGGTESSTAPTAAGTYTVVASFTSASSDYTNARSAPVTFTISPATAQSRFGVTGNGHSITNGATTVSTNGFL